MAYIILLGFCLVCGQGLLKNKISTAEYVVLYMLVAPCIGLGGRKFDSSYVFVAIMLLITIIKHKGKIIVIREMKKYVWLIFVWCIAFTAGWIINNRQSSFAFIMSIAGLIKALLLVYILQECFLLANSEEKINEVIGNGIWKAVVINGIAVFLQFTIPMKMYNICYQLYYSSDTSGYASLSNIDTWGGGFYKGRYYRYFGLFETPMIFSCFSIFVIALVLVQFSTNKVYFKYPKITLLIAAILGLSSQCKVYFFMIPLLVCVYVLYNANRMSKKRGIIIFGIGAALMIVVMFADRLATIPALHYLSYLSDPMSAFSTRFGSGTGRSDGYLIDTLRISLEHFVIGVGPVSVQGEALSDSSYLILLHHGGIVALFAMVLFYFKICITNNKNDRSLNMLTIAILGMALSRTILLSGTIVVISVAYFISVEHAQNKN